MQQTKDHIEKHDISNGMHTEIILEYVKKRSHLIMHQTIGLTDY